MTIENNQGERVFENTSADNAQVEILDTYGMASEDQKKQFDKMGLQPTYTRYLASTELKITRNGETQAIDGSMLYEINFAAKEL